MRYNSNINFILGSKMRDGKRVILCVDDDMDVLNYLSLTLQAEGFFVIQAATAEEGLKKYREHSPDLVIVDLMMEEVDSGAQLCKELRALQNKAPVYVLSSVGDDMHETIDTQELGVSGVFQKPLDKNTLLKVIRARLS